MGSRASPCHHRPPRTATPRGANLTRPPSAPPSSVSVPSWHCLRTTTHRFLFHRITWQRPHFNTLPAFDLPFYRELDSSILDFQTRILGTTHTTDLSHLLTSQPTSLHQSYSAFLFLSHPISPSVIELLFTPKLKLNNLKLTSHLNPYTRLPVQTFYTWGRIPASKQRTSSLRPPTHLFVSLFPQPCQNAQPSPQSPLYPPA